MTGRTCEDLAERLALGEALGTDDEAHVATCPACAGLARLPGLVARAGAAAEPAPGFAARMTAGARGRLVVRRRNRILTTVLAAAGVVAALGVSLKTRDDQRSAPAAIRLISSHDPLDSTGNDDVVDDDAPPATDDQATADRALTTDEELVIELVRLSDSVRAPRPSKAWQRAAARLTPYQHLLTASAHEGAPR